MRQGHSVVPVLLLSVCLGGALALGPARADTALQAVLAAPAILVGNEVLDRPALQAVYGTGNFEPLWLEQGAAGHKVETVLATLENAAEHGLNPADYHVDALKSRLGTQDRSERLVLDLLLTDGLMRYASDVRVGRVSPRQVRGERFVRPQTLDPVALVQQAATAPDLKAFLTLLPPHAPLYWGQVHLLAKLRQMPDWPVVPDGRKLQKGDTSPRVEALRQRLAATGELAQAAPQGATFDAHLEAAVKAWQERSGLEPDGVVGRSSLALLNTPRAVRIDQVLANMERQRWLPDSLGSRYVIVNIPAYHLDAVSEGQVALSMKTIVGRPERPTPIFSDTIRFVEFNPSWGVPSTIAREDILPKLRQDPGYALAHKNVRIYRDGAEVDPWSVDWHSANIRNYSLRAPPGPRNPLGTVKFLFPNSFDVYLHDTSEPAKFAEYARSFSSGCVRVSNPAELANWLLADKPGWSDTKRQQILDSHRQTRLTMENPVPVWLTYTTAWMDENGLPVFRADLYNRDPDLAAAIRTAEAQPRRLVVSMTRATAGQPAVDPTALPGDIPQAAP